MTINASPAEEKRVIKFRAFDPVQKEIIYQDKVFPFTLITQYGLFRHDPHNTGRNYNKIEREFLIMQFTGHQIGGVDLYESDVVRLEENADGIDPADKMTWYVVTWIKEWCMFALLRVNDEYSEYINEGTEGLDTEMFWTFPLDVEDIGPSKYYLCGNIYEHPNLITPQTPTNE